MNVNLKITAAAVIEYAGKEKKSLRRLALSLISLIVACVALITTTFSWFTASRSEVTATNFVLDCGKGLRVNDSGTSELSFSQEKQRYLIPASSVDGRNLFFPTDGSDFSDVTSQMTFRSANVGDKNVNYIQIDFTLTAQQDHTALYINDSKTSLKVAGQLQGENATHRAEDWSVPQAAALRSALWCSTAENGVPNTPIVFNSTSSTLRTAAVAEVDRTTGAFVGDGRQVAHTFSEYSSSGLPVATLAKNVETKFSYIVWLEGTDPKCTDKISAKDIQINLAFTTSWDKTQTIRFRDDTDKETVYDTNLGQNVEVGWVTDLIKYHGYSLSLHYEDVTDGKSTDFNMYTYIDNVDGEWSCNIPGDMTTKISFILRPPTGSGDPTYIFTKSSKIPNTDTFDRGSNRLYVAEGADPELTGDVIKDDCTGYWMALGDSDGAGHDNGGSLDGDDF